MMTKRNLALLISTVALAFVIAVTVYAATTGTGLQKTQDTVVSDQVMTGAADKCQDCDKCRNSEKCQDCKDCIDCDENCQKCEDCDKCQDCKDCDKDCEKCQDCEKCTNGDQNCGKCSNGEEAGKPGSCPVPLLNSCCCGVPAVIKH